MDNYSPEQLQQALQRAQQAGDQQAVQVIQQHMQQAPQGGNELKQLHQFSNDQLNHAYWLASINHDEPSKQAIFSALRNQGGSVQNIPGHVLPAADRAGAQRVIDQMSGTGKFFAGAGKSFYDTGRGLAQLVGARSTAEADQAANLDAPLISSGAGLAGDITGQVAQMALPVGDGAKVAGWVGDALPWAAKAVPYAEAALRAGAFSGAQPVTTGQTRLGNAAEGAAFGVGGKLVGAAGSRIAKGLSDKLPQATKDLYELAVQKGIPVHFSQLSDSKFVKKLAQMVGYLPLSGSGKAADAQRQAFARAVGGTFGSPESALTDDVMAAARKRIGAEFDRIHNANGVQLQPSDISKLNAIAQSAERNLPPDEAQIVKNQITDLIGKADSNGNIPGKAYQAMRTDRLMKLEGSSKPMMANMVRGVRKVADKAADASASHEDAKALATARSQWRNLKTAEKALKRSEGAKGGISPAQLWSIVNQKGGATQDMRDLAKVGQLLKQGVPDSGTPAGNMILGGTGAAGFFNPLLAAKLIAGGATAGRFMNSQLLPRYLVRGARSLEVPAKLLQGAPYVLPAAQGAMKLSGQGQ